MPFVKATDGTNIHYVDSGAGRPMVLLSSAAMGLQMWDRHLPLLAAAGIRVVAYDRRGHGRSDWPWDGYDYDTLADDLACLIEGLGLTEVTLVGNAMGGAELVRYLARHGADRVRRAVLIATVTPTLRRSPDNASGMTAEELEHVLTALRVDRPRYFTEIATPFYAGVDAAPGDVPLSAEFIRWFSDQALQCSSRATIESNRLLFTSDLHEDLPHVTVPTMVIHGARDPIARLAECGEATTGLIKDSQLVVYDDASHGLAVTAADRLVADLLAFARD
ncbi:alpha/beta fold hydrolase [Solwaraspora sp. WMMB335]|uniref:alpha/beta fold hydrolase n=1 Tax=Solwaraspora sp. WMMB335 TaxID=3404118 RepID=UPI003B9384DE